MQLALLIKQYLPKTKIKLLEEIKKSNKDDPEFLIKLLESSHELLNIVIKYNPLSSFTSKSSDHVSTVS